MSNGLEPRQIIHTSKLKSVVETVVTKLTSASMMLGRAVIPNQLISYTSNPCLFITVFLKEYKEQFSYCEIFRFITVCELKFGEYSSMLS
jgi:hypothetical protein